MKWPRWLRFAPKTWDLTALLQTAAFAADPRTAQAERHLWLIRLLDWLRHAPLSADVAEGARAPNPVLRLRHLLNVLDRNPDRREQVSLLLARLWRDVDSAALLADFGFSPRHDFGGELAQRLRSHLLPLTPATTDLGELFGLLFPQSDDGTWLEALDAATLARVAALLHAPPEPVPDPAAEATAAPVAPGDDWRAPFLDAITYLTSAVRAAGFSGPLRRRMSAELLTGAGGEAPFRELAQMAEQLGEHARSGNTAALLKEARYLRALLDACRQCADSVLDHLEEHGVSIDLVFELDQLRQRTTRIEELLNCVLSPAPGPDVARLLAGLVRTAAERRSIGTLFASHYSLLARKVAERSAETGERYITRDASAYRAMLNAALGGGAVIAGTTFVKFMLLALGLSAFWGGLWAGVNYAVSFVVVHLMHWTVATKQPAMTAPAIANKLTDLSRDDAVESFVDEVAHLIRSQAAGIIGNLMAVIPLVLGVQWLWQAAFGAPAIGAKDGEHVLETITLLGPTAFFAAFTGVLLFASSLIAGWVENWFVWHRLDSAIAWNPRFIAYLGQPRAARWAAWWRNNISGLASNISLGLMLGLVPAVAAFFALPIEVRHVTLSTGQLAAAVGALGLSILGHAEFWWCVAGIAATGVLNLAVSFFLAFKVALRSRGIRLAERSRIYRAVRRRMLTRPASFIVPPKQ
jgi:site-specific recombinase